MSHSLSGKNVLVLGLGLHGGAVGTIQWLASQGARISVSDTKTKDELWHSLEKLKDIPNISYYFGNHDELDVTGIDMIIRNPGVPRTSPILQRAKEKNIPIEMDSSLFFECAESKNSIGITGSKGKTTASAAIATVMKAIDSETMTVGVDGVSPLGALISSSLRAPLRSQSFAGRSRGRVDYPIIFELSSWRLEALQEKKISPHIAVVTSIYKDHLNTYKSFDEYIDTKKQIIAYQTKDDIAILNKDDAIIKTWATDVRGELLWFSLEKLGENEQGIWVEGERIFARFTFTTSPSLSLVRRGDDAFSPPYQGGAGGGGEVRETEGHKPTLICSVSDIPHNSSHELRNKLPAILLGILHGADFRVITKALQAQPVLAHRLQFVRTIDGVRFINDSAATIPDATIAAIESFGEKSLIVILGGSDKALEFQNLAKTISLHKNIWHIVWLPGTATQHMKACITPLTKALHHNASNMTEAVKTAHSLAKQGDTILLSPGATSFGLFLHEFDRGDAFIKAVEQLEV